MQRIGLILSGGAGVRMGGADKGALRLGGARLIDRVAERLHAQTERLLISGRHDYGLGLPFIPDRADGPAGPAAGLWAALCWLNDNGVKADGLLTAPADGPFVPLDLAENLCSAEASAVACHSGEMHPTFAWWRVRDLETIFAGLKPGDAPSLKSLCEQAKARRTPFEDADAFFNVNTPDDLARAETLLAAR
ncbi:MAG: molybdenum cofactor guanylyltransferase [Parvularculaceae bacterium]